MESRGSNPPLEPIIKYGIKQDIRDNGSAA